MALRQVGKFIPEGVNTEGGFWKGSFDFIGTIRQILVMPQSPDNVYNLGLKDESGMVTFLEKEITGVYPSDPLEIIVFPGEKHIIIEDAKFDEMFSIKIIYQL